jgi:ABC-2 type transport system permease protein
MSNTWTVCKREFFSYFLTPIGYVLMGAYAAISGLAFTAAFLYYAKVTESPALHAYTGVPDFEETLLSPFLVFCGRLIMLIGPLLTMRLLAEEKARGTMELLLTQPLRDREIIFGKYFAALLMLLVLMLNVIVYMLIVNYFVAVEPAVLIFGLITVFLMGAAFISLGLFISAMTKNPVTAGILTFAVFFLSYIFGSLGENLPEAIFAPVGWPDALAKAVDFGYAIFRRLVLELSLDAHASEMAQGVLAPSDIVYYLLVIAFFLFLTFRVLESPKWRA